MKNNFKIKYQILTIILLLLFSVSQLYSQEKSKKHFTNLMLHGGAVIGGKNSSSYVMAKLVFIDKLHIDYTMFYRSSNSIINRASIFFGKNAGFVIGYDWGNKFYYTGKDSLLTKLQFRNIKTGEYLPFSADRQIHEQVNIISFGLAFTKSDIATNYWRGEGDCIQSFDVKMQFLYSPSIAYDHQIELVNEEGKYENVFDTYEVENVKIKHFGFRFVIGFRHSSKLSLHYELGLKPGIKKPVNEEGTFNNAYLMMGAAVTIGAGGKKYLKEN